MEIVNTMIANIDMTLTNVKNPGSTMQELSTAHPRQHSGPQYRASSISCIALQEYWMQHTLAQRPRPPYGSTAHCIVNARSLC